MNRVRVPIKQILSNPVTRRELIVRTIIFIQAVEGRDLTQAQAEAAYDNMLAEKKANEH